MLMATLSISAKGAESQKTNRVGFYVGTHAALATAESGFSSFGANKFHPGWNAGINTGYRFTNIWSLEVSGSWSHVSLSAQDCCLSRKYAFGSDLNRYHELSIIPEGVATQYYENLMSTVFVQRYGLQVNFNVLGLFKRTKQGPWGLELSPAIYVAGTNANILTKANKISIAKNITTWNLGYGGQLFTSYAVAENTYIGIYGAYTQYVGRPIDGLPRVHSTNYTVDAGVKFIVAFNRKKNTPISEADITTLISDKSFANIDNEQDILPHEESPKEVSSDATVSTDTTTKKLQETPKQEEEVATGTSISISQEEKLTLETPFPIIYFSFNSVWIEFGQRSKVEEIAQTLKANHSIRIRIIGWGDEVGGDNVNKRVSLQRAEAVKKRLERCLISADRIEIVGGGIAPNAPSPEEGRIAIVQIIP